MSTDPGSHPFTWHLAKTARAGVHDVWTPEHGPLPALYIRMVELGARSNVWIRTTRRNKLNEVWS